MLYIKKCLMMIFIQIGAEKPAAGVSIIMSSNCTKYKFDTKWTDQYGQLYYFLDGRKSFCVAGPSAAMLEDDTVVATTSTHSASTFGTAIFIISRFFSSSKFQFDMSKILQPHGKIILELLFQAELKPVATCNSWADSVKFQTPSINYGKWRLILAQA